MREREMALKEALMVNLVHHLSEGDPGDRR